MSFTQYFFVSWHKQRFFATAKQSHWKIKMLVERIFGFLIEIKGTPGVIRFNLTYHSWSHLLSRYENILNNKFFRWRSGGFKETVTVVCVQYDIISQLLFLKNPMLSSFLISNSVFNIVRWTKLMWWIKYQYITGLCLSHN